jgi:hypothetical protein
MTRIDYNALLQQEFTEYSNMLRRRQEIDLELAQKEQFLRATINMLPEDGKKQSWEALLGAMSAGDVGLSDAIRNVLKTAPRRFLTATEVKQMLIKAGFDFSKYTTNPLSSVHAALKRLKPEEAEMSQIDGVMAWRWIKQAPDPTISKEIKDFYVSFRRERDNAALEAAISTLSGLHVKGTGKPATAGDEVRAALSRARKNLTAPPAGAVPNPFGKNLAEMLKGPEKKK